MEYKEDYEYITTQEGVDRVVEWCSDKSYVVFDTETGPQPRYMKAWDDEPTISLDPFRGQIYTMQIGNRFKQFIIDTRADLDLSAITDILRSPDIAVIGVNLRFDCKFMMHHYDCILDSLVDCMIVEQVARAGIFVIGDQNERVSYAVRRETGMRALAKRYLGLDIDKDKDLRTQLWRTPMGQFDKRQLSYMAGDCIYPDLIAREQKKIIHERNLGPALQLEHELIPVIANMELTGIPFDTNTWIKLMQEAQAMMEKNEGVLDRLLGQTKSVQEDLFGKPELIRRLDYSSTKQLAKALTEAGVKGFVNSAGEYESTSSNRITLMQVAGNIDPELANAIKDYRKEKKKLESYGDNFLKARHPLTGRIHPNFTQTCIVTGRMSCSPGMQTIPQSSEYRRAFNSPPGYTLIVLDASQIEARISADITNDEPAIKVFVEGGDIYVEDGERMFQRKIIRHTPEGEKLRSRAKVCWLGLTYGQGKKSFNNYSRLFLGEDLPRSETDFLWDKFFEIHWQMKEVMDMWARNADPLSTNQYFTDSFADTRINPDDAREALLSIYTDRMDEDRALTVVNKLMARKDKVTYTSTSLGRKRFYRADYLGWYTAARNHPIQGCLPADTRILTPDGWTPIGEFSKGAVWTGHEWAPARRLNRGPAERVRLHLSNGTTFDCDDRHKLLTTHDGQTEWTHVKDLEGRTLVMDYHPHFGEPRGTAGEWYARGIHGAEVPPEVFTVDRPRRMAYVMGRRSINRNGDAWCVENPAIAADLVRLLQTLGFGARAEGNRVISQEGEIKAKVEHVQYLGVLETMYTLTVDHERHAFSSEGLISKNTAADIQKTTMNEFQRFHWNNDIDAHIINVVHDEIITLVRNDQAEELLAEQIRIGNEVGKRFLRRVPMRMEGGITDVWTKEL